MGVLAVIITLLKVGLWIILGFHAGLIIGYVTRYLVTNLALIPLFALLPPSPQNDEYWPIINTLGKLILFTGGVAGAIVAYHFGSKKQE